MGRDTTNDAPGVGGLAGGRHGPVPGLVLTFAKDAPLFRVFSSAHGPFILGRLDLSRPDQLGSTISRKHIRVRFEGMDCFLRDLGSRNGTFVAGRRIVGEERVVAGSLLRADSAILLAVQDVVPFSQHGTHIREGMVIGPQLHAVLQQISQISQLSRSLLISGESGSGKEFGARAFHRAGSESGGPFVVVNCAAIPRDLAERLLFGSRRGAFSGATDANGYAQAAHGGTLFLDEIAELPLDVQGKLLRLVETQEVMRLGATRHESLDVRICAATWRDLRGEVAAGRFREDLFFRIGQPEVRLPPLRERLEEIPWHLEQALRECAPQLTLTSAFVEACMLRSWPGNIRELRSEARRAAANALSAGGQALTVEALSPTAGMSIVRAAWEPRVVGGAQESLPSFPDDDVYAALNAEMGNVSRAAQRLGIHRNRVRRWLERHGGVAGHFRSKMTGEDR